MQTQVIQVLHLLEIAGHIAVCGVDGWSFKGAEPNGEPDCEVAYLSRTDLEQDRHSVILTASGIDGGHWEGECFVCMDHEGSRISLEMSVRTALKPVGEAQARFYFMDEKGLIHELPKARTYAEAFEHAPESSAWVFSHSGLLLALASASKALARQELKCASGTTEQREAALPVNQA